MNKIFIVDDEEDILISLSFWLKRKGYEVETFSNSRELMNGVEDCTPDLILMDVNLKGEDGREVCNMLKTELSCCAPVILVSANPANGQNFRHYQAEDFVEKPFSLLHLSGVIASYC